MDEQVFSNLDDLIAAERARRAGTAIPAELVPDPDSDGDAESPVVAAPAADAASPEQSWISTPEGKAARSESMKQQWEENRDEMLARQAKGRVKAAATLRRKHATKRAGANGQSLPVDYRERIARREQTMMARYGTLSPTKAARLAPKGVTLFGRLSDVLTGQPPLLTREISARLAAQGSAVANNTLSARLTQLTKDGSLLRIGVKPVTRYTLAPNPNTTHRRQVSRAEQAVATQLEQESQPMPKRRTQKRRQPVRAAKPTIAPASDPVRRALYRQAVRTAFEHRELELMLAEIGAATLRATYE